MRFTVLMSAPGGLFISDFIFTEKCCFGASGRACALRCFCHCQGNRFSCFPEEHGLFRSVYAVLEDDLSFPELREAKVVYGIFAYAPLGSPLFYMLLTRHWITTECP